MKKETKKKIMLKIGEKFTLAGIRMNSKMWKTLLKPISDALDEVEI